MGEASRFASSIAILHLLNVDYFLLRKKRGANGKCDFAGDAI
jgi:hypothetical protein